MYIYLDALASSLHKVSHILTIPVYRAPRGGDEFAEEGEKGGQPQETSKSGWMST